VIGQGERGSCAIGIRSSHRDVFSFTHDLKAQHLEGPYDAAARRIDRKFHATAISPSAIYAASTSLSSSKASVPKLSI
jgi:hypothetical protein